ncbi:MAG: glycosyltransferase family 4 protein [Candidatus Adiutrix sp.]|jgi:alpha-1,3-rhamnosyl/mannosyltransferase|nr:glycosyltransferase family 4 protein [Candidatus Adiutrix sp.]
MKVIFNIETVTYPLTGIGRYAYELGRALERSGRLENLMLWREYGPSYAWPDLTEVSSRPGNSLKGRLRNGLRNIGWAAKGYFRLKHLLMAKALNKHHDHLYHSPNFYLPPFVGPKVVSVHDLSFIAHPECHPAYRVTIMNDVLGQIQKLAQHIITISEFSKKEIAGTLGWPLDGITVTPLAAADVFHPRAAEALAPLLADYDLTPNSYSLFVGTIEPRKNIAVMLDAYECLPEYLRNRYPLVVSGFEGWLSGPLRGRLNRLARQGWLRYRGFLPSAHLPLLMAGARLFLFPSFYEGFGLPPLEAMQSGVPVIVSNKASLPEVVGQAAPKLDPGDVESWAEWIRRALEDEAWRREAVELGLRQAAGFSWDKCASKTLSAYDAALAGM